MDGYASNASWAAPSTETLHNDAAGWNRDPSAVQGRFPDNSDRDDRPNVNEMFIWLTTQLSLSRFPINGIENGSRLAFVRRLRFPKANLPEFS
jgi:hypothetical protein